MTEQGQIGNGQTGRVANQSKITIRKNPSGEPLFQPLPYVARRRKSLEADLNTHLMVLPVAVILAACQAGGALLNSGH